MEKPPVKLSSTIVRTGQIEGVNVAQTPTPAAIVPKQAGKRQYLRTPTARRWVEQLSSPTLSRALQ